MFSATHPPQVEGLVAAGLAQRARQSKERRQAMRGAAGAPAKFAGQTTDLSARLMGQWQ